MDQWLMATMKHSPKGKVLVFRLDLIGDYLMCRPFFDSLKRGSSWQNMDWVFAGNSIYKDLSERLDSDVFQAFIWIDRAQFINSIGYRFSVLKRIRQAGFEVVIYPSHTRQYWLESVVRVSGAVAVSPTSVGKYMNAWESELTRRRYAQVIDTGSIGQFEFYRNQRFFSVLSPMALQVENLLIPALNEANVEDFPKGNFMIVAPGASTRNREWPLENFARVAGNLALRFNLEVVVIGGKREEVLGQRLRELLPKIRIQNQAGKLDLYQSLLWLRAATLLISNESAPIHMAASTGTPAICISQGNHFSRWNPYPKSVASWVKTIYPPAFGDVQTQFEFLTSRFHDYSDWSIEEILPDQVINQAEKLLP
jgi:ADP-heptose:LPS heptosyltransferase